MRTSVSRYPRRASLLNLAQRRGVAIEVSLVAADERRGALPERRRRARRKIVPSQIRLDDAVEHRDQRRPFLVQRLRHLGVADPADVRERAEEPRQRDPRDRARRVRQRRIRVNSAQGAFDVAAAFEDRGDLRRRDPSATAVRQPQVALVERDRAGRIVGVIAGVRTEEPERQLEWSSSSTRREE